VSNIKVNFNVIIAHIAPPGDFIALGKHSKSSSSDADLGKTHPPKKLGVPPGKREAPSIGGSSLVKKPKLIGQTFTPLGRSDVERKSSPAPTPVPTSQYEELAIEGLYNFNIFDDFRNRGVSCLLLHVP
jgi:hypothetical protein